MVLLSPGAHLRNQAIEESVSHLPTPSDSLFDESGRQGHTVHGRLARRIEHSARPVVELYLRVVVLGEV